MNSKIILVLAFVAAAAADKRPSFGYGPPQVSRPSYGDSDESFESPRYNFQFDVDDEYTGASFEHQEDRDDHNTQGSYTVQLPDGRRQTVTYYVNGDSGYVAEVTYEGEAQYPESDESREYSAPRPSYSAPKPAPRPSYSAPKPAPRPSYSAPRPTPRPSYSAPRPSYSAPRPSPPKPSRGYGFPQ